MMWMELTDGGPEPKRGDIVQTNIGNRRERTWMILHSHRMRSRESTKYPRFKLWMVRWWELEPDFRMRLYRSACRAGGQGVFHLVRYKPKRKRRFAL